MSTNRAHDEKKVVVVFGLIASGKTCLAKNWARRPGFCYYNTDIVRKDLAKRMARDFQRTQFGNELYSPSMSRKTYGALIDRARSDLLDPVTQVVVLDGSFSDVSERVRVVSALGVLGSVYFVYCFCSDSCRKTRLKIRAADPHAISDGSWDIYQEQKKHFSAPDALGGVRLLELNTDTSLSELSAALDVFIGLD